MTLCQLALLAFIFYNLLSKQNLIRLISITAFCFLRNYINEILTINWHREAGGQCSITSQQQSYILPTFTVLLCSVCVDKIHGLYNPKPTDTDDKVTSDTRHSVPDHLPPETKPALTALPYHKPQL